MKRELLPLEHPLVPRPWWAPCGQGAWAGTLVFLRHTIACCHHLHRSETKAYNCAERARDKLRAGEEIDW